MRRLIYGVLILSLSAGGHSAFAKTTLPTVSKDTIVVKSITDGDTISVMLSGKKESVRLIGIDAPESNTTRFGYVECFGKESSLYLTSLLSGKKITLTYDTSQ
ncbi:TPA: hypothetical protein DCZ39_00760 [Patescibacteria group bacterium]|nr:hypothetical protein [Candidatus Gracilibacteria bacterium]